MALVRLSDAIVPEVFTPYMTYETVQKADLFRSGLVSIDPSMANLMASGGRLFQTPMWLDLGNEESSLGSDDPSKVLIPKKLGSSKHQFVRQVRTQGWSSADLVKELAGSDPGKRIADRVAEYWARDFDRRVVATLTGVVNRNVASESSDMVKDVSAVAGTTVIGGQTYNNFQLNPNVIIDARQTMGDKAFGKLKWMLMHSVVYSELMKKNLIQFTPNSEGKITEASYLGYSVLVTDNVPAVIAGSDVIYTTYLVGPGVIRFAESPVDMPTEIKREPLQGNGMGIEILINRRQYGMHFDGYNWADGSVAELFPTDAEIATAGNWARTVGVERKAIPFVAIKTKNG